MKTVYATYYNADMTEGRGPMVLDKIFTNRVDANAYIDTKFGVMGRPGPWSNQKYGDWTVQEHRLFDSLDDAAKDHDREVRKRALGKLTDEERKVLGI